MFTHTIKFYEKPYFGPKRLLRPQIRK